MKIQVVEVRSGVYCIIKIKRGLFGKNVYWYDGIGSEWYSRKMSFTKEYSNKESAIRNAEVLAAQANGQNVVWDSSKQFGKIKEVDKAFDITKRMIAAKNSGDDELEQILFMQLVEHNEKYLTQ